MTTWLIDTHLHFYPCYSAKTWLESLFAHFRNHASTLPDSSIQFAAFLTERTSENYFETWKNLSSIEGYSVSLTNATNDCLTITAPEGERLVLFNGQQLITTEGVEVLSLGRKFSYSDRELSISQAVEAIIQGGAIAVLPWSFGKWHGKRLHAVQNALQQIRNFCLLGDIYGRDSISGHSLTLLKEKFQVKVISGTDPLPMKGEEKLAGSKVSIVTLGSDIVHEDFIKSFLHALQQTHAVAYSVTQKENLLRTLIRQLALRLQRLSFFRSQQS